MVYFSGAEGSPAYNKAREFSQKISTVGVDGRNKESWLLHGVGGERGRVGVITLVCTKSACRPTAWLSHVRSNEHIHARR